MTSFVSKLIKSIKPIPLELLLPEGNTNQLSQKQLFSPDPISNPSAGCHDGGPALAHWVDGIFKNLSTTLSIGQLFTTLICPLLPSFKEARGNLRRH